MESKAEKVRLVVHPINGLCCLSQDIQGLLNRENQANRIVQSELGFALLLFKWKEAFSVHINSGSLK